MNVDLLARTRVSGGDDERLPIEHESDMAHEAFVQDGVNLRLVVYAALGQTFYLVRSVGE